MTIAAQFHIPLTLTTQAFEEYNTLMLDLEQSNISHSELDAWTYGWGNGIYSSNKFYNFLYQGIQVEPPGFGRVDVSQSSRYLHGFW